MQSIITKLEVNVAGKIYQLLCDADSSLQHVKEALFQFTNHVGKVQEMAANASPVPPPVQAPEVVAPENVAPAACPAMPPEPKAE